MDWYLGHRGVQTLEELTPYEVKRYLAELKARREGRLMDQIRFGQPPIVTNPANRRTRRAAASVQLRSASERRWPPVRPGPSHLSTSARRRGYTQRPPAQDPLAPARETAASSRPVYVREQVVVPVGQVAQEWGLLNVRDGELSPLERRVAI
jgi:hypothetical protein